MKVATDASALVGEALRQRGRDLIEHPEIDLYIAEATWSEVEHELRRRMAAMATQGRIPAARLDGAVEQTLAGLRSQITIVPAEEYRPYEAEARARVPRDPNDWSTVAVALTLGAGAWTHDYDFFGCGVPVWITQTLTSYLTTFQREA